MSIQSEITRISGNVSDALSAIEAKGVTVPSGSNSDDLADLIALIEGGGGGSGGIIYQDAEGYIHLSEDAANVISIVDELDTAGGTIRTITGATESGGGGLTKETGSFTVASNSVTMFVTGLGGTPKVVKFFVHENALDGVAKIVGGIYAYGPCSIQQTNSGGTAYGNVYTKISDYMNDPTIPADNTDPGTDTVIATSTGFAVHAHSTSWQFKAGYTYDYVVLY